METKNAKCLRCGEAPHEVREDKNKLVCLLCGKPQEIKNKG